VAGPGLTPTAAPTAPAPPRLVNLSRWLWIGSAALSAVRTGIQLTDRTELINQIKQTSPGLSQDDLDAAASGSVLFMLFVSLLVLAGYSLLANRMAGGRNWARIVLTVVGGLGLAIGAIGMAGVASGLATALGLSVRPLDVSLSAVGLLVDAAALTLMWLPASTPHFAARRRVLPGHPL
jgi:hypothetical protein